MLTLTEYEQHRELIAKRDAIISELRNEEATHITISKAWHGYEIEAGTFLLLSPELGELFGRSEIRDVHGCVAHWFILENGHIANLWACEVEEVNECCQEPAPSTVSIARAPFTGQLVATCSECSFIGVYWECACALVHDCEGNE